MHREQILQKLQAYRPLDAADAANRDRMARFIEATPRCFDRSNPEGHITGSGWLIDRTRTRVLLTHHRKLHKWLQLGGHCDGDPDVIRVAHRECEEESGLSDIILLSDQIFDLDIHPIPAIGQDPSHQHYDIRFLFQTTGDETFTVSDESHALAWFTADELLTADVGASVSRMRHKWLTWNSRR